MKLCANQNSIPCSFRGIPKYPILRCLSGALRLGVFLRSASGRRYPGLWHWVCQDLYLQLTLSKILKDLEGPWRLQDYIAFEGAYFGGSFSSFTHLPQ